MEILYLLSALTLAVVVAMDAARRGMNPMAWGVGVFALMIVFLPWYLIVRKPRIKRIKFHKKESFEEICINCGTESKRIRKYFIYFGKMVSYEAEDAGGDIMETRTYKMFEEPISDFVCSKCIIKERLAAIKLFLISVIVALVAFVVALVLEDYGYQGWKVFFMIVAALSSIATIAFFAEIFVSKDELGDRVVKRNYMFEVLYNGYDTTQTRKDKRNDKYHTLSKH